MSGTPIYGIVWRHPHQLPVMGNDEEEEDEEEEDYMVFRLLRAVTSR